ncbi:hypothetical protein [Luteimonas sp. FCS-9]|uniref:hypothetical protein n=1 Tax=Luteimonas sp. FCS-9 TaxID=1547516 RepID=UPI000B280945|nr:hypothetical protein [Luteimonas sp. FCS-9]
MTKRITTAGELHRHLNELQNFNFGPDKRDESLYEHLKLSLGLPEGEFLLALDKAQTSSAAYLAALMSAAAPFSMMYRGILDYCKKTETRKTAESTHVQWDIVIDGMRVPFSLENLRIYDKIESFVKPDLKKWCGTKNAVMNWLSHEVFQEVSNGLANYAFDWNSIKLFRILKDAHERAPEDFKGIFKGLTNLYIQPEHGPAPADLCLRITEHENYRKHLDSVQKTFGESSLIEVASQFIELPMWKFRWQIYEIWILCTVLKQLEQVGFELKPSDDSRSLLELGHKAIVAIGPNKTGAVVYQPTYTNSTGNSVKPDVAVTLSDDVSHNAVELIVEAKQRFNLAKDHVNEVARNYSAAVSDVGRVIVVNYDHLGSLISTDYDSVILLGNVRPSSEGEKSLKQGIARSPLSRGLREEVWYVDVSMSMKQYITPELRGYLRGREAFALRVTSFSFALEVTKVCVDEIRELVGLSDLPCDPMYEGKGIFALQQHANEMRKSKPNARIYVVSDLAQKFRALAEGFEDGIHLLHPTELDADRIYPS